MTLLFTSRRRMASATAVALAVGMVSCSNNSAEEDAPIVAEQQEPDPARESEAQESTESPTTTVTAAPVEGEPFPGDAVDEEFINDSLATSMDVLATPDVATDISAVATGAALEELENQRAEYAYNGWYQEGTPQVVSANEVDSPDADTRVAEVCVDNSQVKTFDSSGAQLNADRSPEEQRSLMLITFVNSGDGWKMSEMGFAEDPRC